MAGWKTKKPRVEGRREGREIGGEQREDKGNEGAKYWIAGLVPTYVNNVLQCFESVCSDEHNTFWSDTDIIMPCIIPGGVEWSREGLQEGSIGRGS